MKAQSAVHRTRGVFIWVQSLNQGHTPDNYAERFVVCPLSRGDLIYFEQITNNFSNRI